MQEIKNKPVILTFISFYLPGYRGGGPIRTIANIVDRLSEDFCFLIVTTDRDLGDKNPYTSIKNNEWHKVGSAQVYYLNLSESTPLNICRLIRNTNYDVLYLNSFFDKNFTLTPLLAHNLKKSSKSVIIAPRGEFSEGALKLKKWKKLFFIHLITLSGVIKNVLWQASTTYELNDIKKAIKASESNINMARNIAIAPDLFNGEIRNKEIKEAAFKIDKTTLRVCFLSRIAPMKNLDFALKVLAKVKVNVVFNIYGPIEISSYWEKCEALIKILPENVSVTYNGSVENSLVRKIIATHDVFFVPSHGENFGHVFLESLSVGVPILVSDQTPWRDLKKNQLGWDIPLDQPDEFIRSLEEAAGYDEFQRIAIRERCVDFAREKAEDRESIEMNRNLFRNAISMKNFINT